MRTRNLLIAMLMMGGCGAVVVDGVARPQAPARGTAPTGGRTAAQAPARGAQAGGRQVHGTMNQVMRGILFPNSNVIFAGQAQDPAAIKPDADASLATNPLASTYGGWQAVENSGIALAEAANLLTIPGRVCSNGRPAPVQNADWVKFVQDLRAAGMAAYKAAQSKKQDAIVEVSDQMATACSNCHDVYREKEPRCTK